jgi:hypothetical protein
MKITSIIKIDYGTYFINNILILKIKKDSSIEVSYDEKCISEEEILELIQEFLSI